LNLSAFTQGACKQDVEKFCPGMGLDKSKIERCIFEHRAEVLEACKANIKEMEKEKEGRK
jgi:hypothetical protein